MAASIYPLWAAMAIHHAARHYTLAGKLDKVVGRSKSDKGSVPEVYRPIRPDLRKGTHQKNKSRE
jgi:hypothetical protein